jgi:hypothetical protein
MTRTAAPGDPWVEPGQTRSFTVSLLDPPMFASAIDISFVTGGSAHVRQPARAVNGATAAEEPPALPRAMSLGPPIPEARPLPSASPYAVQAAPAAP